MAEFDSLLAMAERKARAKVRGVFEHPKGSDIWWCQYFENGKRKRERVGRWSDAVTLYQKRKTQILRGEKLPELQRKRVTVAELIDAALEYAREHNRVMRNYQGKAEQLRKDLGPRVADDLTVDELGAWIKKRGRSAATFNRYRSFLSLCYREGMRSGKVSKNPARLLAQKQEPRGRKRFLDRENEYPKVVAALEQKFPDRVPAFLFSIFSGARLGEQFALHWGEVNFEQRELTFVDTKNGEDRTVPMNSLVHEILSQMRDERTSKRAPVFGDLREFCCMPGEKLQPDVDSAGYSPKWFRDLCQSLEIHKYTWHNNRHTFCSWLAIDGASLKEIQELAGHKDIKTTARYAHLSPDSKRSVMERLVTPLRAKVLEFKTGT